MRMTQQFAASPAACLGLLIGIAGSISRTPVALQLPSNARWRAIQSCRDLPQRFIGLATPGNLAALFNIEMTKALSHDNTPNTGCCISFVNSGNPAFALSSACHSRGGGNLAPLLCRSGSRASAIEDRGLLSLLVQRK